MSKSNTGFDFASLDIATAAEQPFEFELQDPRPGVGGLGVFVSVIGAESSTFQAYIRKEANDNRRRDFEKKRKGGDDQPLLVEDEETAMLGALVTCIRGWRTVVDGTSKPVVIWGGKELEFTPENAAAWLKQFPFVRAQVNAATGEMGNFIKA